MMLSYGDISRYGSVAYVSQRPFIQNSTLQANITFGLPYDEEKYQKTLDQCALLPDLKVVSGSFILCYSFDFVFETWWFVLN